MGVELQLERRVPDKEAVQTASTLERAELPLPNDLVEHCGRQLLRGSRTWEVVRYEGQKVICRCVCRDTLLTTIMPFLDSIRPARLLLLRLSPLQAISRVLRPQVP